MTIISNRLRAHPEHDVFSPNRCLLCWPHQCMHGQQHVAEVQNPLQRWPEHVLMLTKSHPTFCSGAAVGACPVCCRRSHPSCCFSALCKARGKLVIRRFRMIQASPEAPRTTWGGSCMGGEQRATSQRSWHMCRRISTKSCTLSWKGDKVTNPVATCMLQTNRDIPTMMHQQAAVTRCTTGTEAHPQKPVTVGQPFKSAMCSSPPSSCAGCG